MKVDGSLKSLLQGVSQQPPRERLPGQCTEQINFSADPVTGLTRRPPTDLVATLPNRGDDVHWFNFRVRTGVGYVAQLYEGGIDVADLNGNIKTVNVANNDYLDYLTGTAYSTSVVGNDVYISNRSITTGMDPDSTVQYANVGEDAYYFGGIIQVLGGGYARKYAILIDGVEVAYYTTPDGSDAGMAERVRTSYISQMLYEALTSVVDASSVGGERQWGIGHMQNSAIWEVTRRNDIILTKNKNNVRFSISVSDDTGGTVLKSCTDQIKAVEDLPRWAEQGFAVRIATNTDSDYDMWMVFQTEESNIVGAGFGSNGYWKEAAAPDTPTTIDATTMPHILEYDPTTDEFNFKEVEFIARGTGNEVSNPDPSFIGNTISDVSLFQSRLVFVSGNFVIMSRTNRFGDFFIGSLSGIVDTDPIDIGSNAQEASAMVWIVPHNKDLCVFSPSAQFVMYGRTGVTPSNATLSLSTSFESDIGAKPAPCGKNVFFANTFGRYSGVREFFTEISGETNDTRPITSHVKKYIEGRIQHFTASSNYDMLLVRTNQNKNVLYMYQFIWADNEKIQSSWSKVEFSRDILHSFFDEAVVYFVVKTANGPSLIRQFLDVADSDGVEYGVHLDYRFDVFDVHRAFLLPYNWLADEDLSAVQGPLCPNPGMPVPIESIVYDEDTDDYIVTLRYDMEGGDIVVGSCYRSSYIPTPPRIKDESNVEIANAKLKIKNYIVSLSRTGHIAGKLISKYYDVPPVEFTGRIVGDIENMVGVQVLTDEKFLMPVRELSSRASVEFYTDSEFPLTMLDIEWIGQYWKSGRRIDTGD